MLQTNLHERAARLIGALRAQHLVIATAESCTGGLIAATLTSVPGASDVFDRSFVTYSNTAKVEMLRIPAALIEEHGAVSAEVAAAMAAGAIVQGGVDIAVAATGVAGPAGGTAEKPVGLVYLAAAGRDGRTLVSKCHFANDGRDAIRIAAVIEAFGLVENLVDSNRVLTA